MQDNQVQMTGTTRRTRELRPPETVNPDSIVLNKVSVNPIEITEEPEHLQTRNMLTIIIIAAFAGLASGVFLLVTANTTHLADQFRSSGGMLAHCLIWGVVFGAGFGAAISPAYTHLASPWIAYALLLFIPLLMFLLTGVFLWIAGALLAVGRVLLTILVVVIIIAVIWGILGG